MRIMFSKSTSEPAEPEFEREHDRREPNTWSQVSNHAGYSRDHGLPAGGTSSMRGKNNTSRFKTETWHICTFDLILGDGRLSTCPRFLITYRQSTKVMCLRHVQTVSQTTMSGPCKAMDREVPHPALGCSPPYTHPVRGPSHAGILHGRSAPMLRYYHRF